MAFFGIGGSKKKPQASEGVVHDSKQDADSNSQDILAEFEAQFSQQGSQPPSNQPVEPVPTPQPPPPQPSVQESSPPARNAQPSRPPEQRSEPSVPESITAPTSIREPPRSKPSSSDDLPDFDFDFHPSEPILPQRAEPVQTPSPAPQPPPQQPAMNARPPVPPTPRAPVANEQPRMDYPPRHEPVPQPPRRPMSESHTDFELPEFTDTFNESSRSSQAPKEKPTWLDDSWSFSGNDQPHAQEPSRAPMPDRTPSGPPEPLRSPMPQRTSTSPPQPVRNEPEQPPAAKPEPERPDVVMRDGTLFIEKHALARHVSDLGMLRGLSHTTSEQFTRIDSYAKDEKKLLTKMQAAVQTLYDNLEHADELLFSGD